MQGEDVIYKVSVERWPLQQLPPVASDGIITQFWCIAKSIPFTTFTYMPHKNTSVDVFANIVKQQKCVLNTILTMQCLHCTHDTYDCIVLLPLIMAEDGITMADGNKALFIN